MSAELSRAVVAAMSTSEYRERRAEVRRWVEAGAPEGQPAPAPPVLKRPEGHRFTLAEVEGMTQAEHVANGAAIKSQIAAGELKGRRRARSVSPRAS